MTQACLIACLFLFVYSLHKTSIT